MWTPDEDNLLRNGVHHYGARRWHCIASIIPNRSEHSCSVRWDELQNRWTVPNRQPWSVGEDDTLRSSVDFFGAKQWAIAASFLPGRTSRQCRERWHNQLDPSIKHDAWSNDEDEQLVTLQRQFGNAWSRIASLLPGRSDNAIKNRWHSARLQRHKHKKDENLTQQEETFVKAEDDHANSGLSPPREVLDIAEEMFTSTHTTGADLSVSTPMMKINPSFALAKDDKLEQLACFAECLLDDSLQKADDEQ